MLVSTFEQLQQAVRDCPHDWVLKHPFGFSGRERGLGKRARISDFGFGRRLGPTQVESGLDLAL